MEQHAPRAFCTISATIFIRAKGFSKGFRLNCFGFEGSEFRVQSSGRARTMSFLQAPQVLRLPQYHQWSQTASPMMEGKVGDMKCATAAVTEYLSPPSVIVSRVIRTLIRHTRT